MHAHAAPRAVVYRRGVAARTGHTTRLLRGTCFSDSHTRCAGLCVGLWWGRGVGEDSLEHVDGDEHALFLLGEAVLPVVKLRVRAAHRHRHRQSHTGTVLRCVQHTEARGVMGAAAARNTRTRMVFVATRAMRSAPPRAPPHTHTTSYPIPHPPFPMPHPPSTPYTLHPTPPLCPVVTVARGGIDHRVHLNRMAANQPAAMATSTPSVVEYSFSQGDSG